VKDNGELFVREFKLTCEGSTEERKVFQYQYTAWPDQGIPPTFNSFLDIVKWIDEKKGKAPVVVHCSAGLGRSGAFAMVHASLKKLERDLSTGSEPIFDMATLVINMRKQRHGLIQTGKQFEFVYRAIAEGSEKHLQEKK
jgi:protein tyrosine phosphatase